MLNTQKNVLTGMIYDYFYKMSDEFRGRPLSTIGDDVLEMGKDLEHVTPVMIDCLKTVAACKDYIYWLRKEVQGAFYKAFP